MENVMITAWNWILLTDFSSFKPTFLPEDNPAEFSYFFDTSRRRICYIAPERFKTRTITVEAATNPTLSTSIISDETSDADGEADGELLASMDIFSGQDVFKNFKSYRVLSIRFEIKMGIADLIFVPQPQNMLRNDIF